MILFLALLGCTPTCDEVCSKLVECENEGTERMSADECSESCTAQQALYATWTDTVKRQAFDDELTCLYNAECSNIADGECYDDEVWSY